MRISPPLQPLDGTGWTIPTGKLTPFSQIRARLHPGSHSREKRPQHPSQHPFLMMISSVTKILPSTF
jgi:hypothetical protein